MNFHQSTPFKNVRYHLKACLYFQWYFICYDCSAGTCARGVKFGQSQKINVVKSHQYLNSALFFFGGFRYNECVTVSMLYVLQCDCHVTMGCVCWPVNTYWWASIGYHMCFYDNECLIKSLSLESFLSYSECTA